jgi:hypothetical protein
LGLVVAPRDDVPVLPVDPSVQGVIAVAAVPTVGATGQDVLSGELEFERPTRTTIALDLGCPLRIRTATSTFSRRKRRGLQGRLLCVLSVSTSHPGRPFLVDG